MVKSKQNGEFNSLTDKSETSWYFSDFTLWHAAERIFTHASQDKINKGH